MLRTAVLFVTLLLLLTGCATGVTVKVNAIADPLLHAAGKKYFLTNGVVESPKDDLFFREFARYFERALATKGYERVDDRSAADLIISFSYGISDGRTGINTFSFPISHWPTGQSSTRISNTIQTTPETCPNQKAGCGEGSMMPISTSIRAISISFLGGCIETGDPSVPRV